MTIQKSPFKATKRPREKYALEAFIYKAHRASKKVV